MKLEFLQFPLVNHRSTIAPYTHTTFRQLFKLPKQATKQLLKKNMYTYIGTVYMYISTQI